MHNGRDAAGLPLVDKRHWLGLTEIAGHRRLQPVDGERKDPPRKLLKLAVEIGCCFSIDTEAHAPGQLEWQYIGCDRAAECGVTEDRVINTGSANKG